MWKLKAVLLRGGDSSLGAAENLWKQANHGAWLALEELPPIDRVMPEVIDLRLRILTCTCRWELGDDLIEGKTVTSIGVGTFRGCTRLTGVTIPSGVPTTPAC